MAHPVMVMTARIGRADRRHDRHHVVAATVTFGWRSRQRASGTIVTVDRHSVAAARDREGGIGVMVPKPNGCYLPDARGADSLAQIFVLPLFDAAHPDIVPGG